MNFENLLYEVSDGIATVTVNRPKALNALNAATLKELINCFAAIRDDEAVKVVILTGGGEKAFVAGADIAEMQSLDAVEASRFARLGHELAAAVEELPKPVIAAVNGYALGGGCELALCCDIRLAAENAQFGQPEVNLGVIPGFGGTQRLARLIGKGLASELIMTGDMIDAAEAHRIGLVNKVFPAADLMTAARKMAGKIASKGLVAVGFAKAALRDGLEMDLARACNLEADLFGLCFATADQKEGMQAFLEKRPAKFVGK
ncbi:short chain enoyl-CoA hydratase [Geothermobacter ehrlichii]|uniref:Short chain enoyl-CoA hydratase n=1 Tax=Geothermobacter ehrlichii TaxID=213224 RepID=A0A5D3WJW7_9BACT|nr:enoyl-CoA hydratase-related protein [Geothermobacter ehrlichii]TYO98601.1 short chain enoyl-CoA hydratase [Geothermobacter ehrlichii]